MHYINIVAIGLGGCFGALSRFYLNEAVVKRFPESSYWGTLGVNVLGCLCIGFLMAIFAEHQKSFPQWLFFFLITGFLGSLTTFSTFGFQTFELIRENRPTEAALSVFANLACGLLAVLVGRVLAFPWTQ